MYKIAVVGDRDSISGYAAIGMTVVPVQSGEAALEAVSNLAGAGYGVIFVTENVYDTVNESFPREGALPAVIPIPGASGNTGTGMADVSRFVEKAVGSDIIS